MKASWSNDYGFTNYGYGVTNNAYCVTEYHRVTVTVLQSDGDGITLGAAMELVVVSRARAALDSNDYGVTNNDYGVTNHGYGVI
jgi:hypothetical protein